MWFRAQRVTESGTRPKPFGALIFDNRTTTALRGNAASAQVYKARLLLLGRAIAERFRSDSAPILQPQSDTRDHKTYVLFVFFVAKQRKEKRT